MRGINCECWWMFTNVLQVKPFYCRMLTAAICATVHQLLDPLMDPLNVPGHPGVEAILALASAAFAPTHNASDEVGVIITCDVWPTTITLASIPIFVASTEHAMSDWQPSGIDAGLTVHVSYNEALHDHGRNLSLPKTSKTTDHSYWLPHQDLKLKVKNVSRATVVCF